MNSWYLIFDFLGGVISNIWFFRGLIFDRIPPPPTPPKVVENIIISTDPPPPPPPPKAMTEYLYPYSLIMMVTDVIYLYCR